MQRPKIKRRIPLKCVKLNGTTITLTNCRKGGLRFVLTHYRAGKRIDQKYFPTKIEGEALFQVWKNAAINHGIEHGSIANEERAAMILFREAVAKMVEPRPTLLDCVNSFLATIANQLSPITVNQLVELRVKAAVVKGVRKRTLSDLIGTDGTGGRLGAFATRFGERQVAEITHTEIEDWLTLNYPSPASRREVIVRLNGLFEAGIKKGHLTKNPMISITKPSANIARATILPVSECARLLASCADRSLPAVAVQLFAGLRKAETMRLDWRDIPHEVGEMKVIQHKGVTKREKLRLVPVLPTLLAWLQPHRRDEGPIFPTGQNDDEPSDQCYRTDFAKARKLARLLRWDENTLRHCYASYRKKSTDSLEKVKVEIGHTRSSTTEEFYVNPVTTQEAEAFWALRPVSIPPTENAKESTP